MTGLILVLNIFCSPILKAQTNTAAAKNYHFTNGQWFDGKKFRRQTFYSANGILTQSKPSKIDETIDLQNGYVVPPFSDAHCHMFDASYNVKQQIDMYLQDGVFYAKSQTNVRTGAAAVADKVNIPTSVDVSYAHGALTHTFGHGIEIYESLALGFYGNQFDENVSKIAASRLRDNDAYYIIDTADDLERKWQKILDGKPNFIKIYLLTSEDYEEKLKNIPNIRLGSIGLDPKLVPAIVKKAHAAGLRVSAHVDTEYDYRIALEGGVDEMAHMPGYYIESNEKLEEFLLTERDALETVKRKVWVIPTPILPKDFTKPNDLTKVETVTKRNLTTLKNKKAQIAIGADHYGKTSVDYAIYISSLGVFSNLEMLKIWCEDTPQTIFPNRKIGNLKSGYEASFLVLSGDPLGNFEQVRNIKMRFKQGYLINL